MISGRLLCQLGFKCSDYFLALHESKIIVLLITVAVDDDAIWPNIFYLLLSLPEIDLLLHDSFVFCQHIDLLSEQFFIFREYFSLDSHALMFDSHWLSFIVSISNTAVSSRFSVIELLLWRDILMMSSSRRRRIRRVDSSIIGAR